MKEGRTPALRMAPIRDTVREDKVDAMVMRRWRWEIQHQLKGPGNPEPMAIRLHKYSHATHTHQFAHTSLKRRVDTFIYRVPLYHLSNNLCPESL